MADLAPVFGHSVTAADDEDADIIQDEESSAPRFVERLRQAIARSGGPTVVMQKSGVKNTTLRRVLGGQEAKRSTLIALADACGVSVEWLATGRGRPGKALPVTDLADQPVSGSVYAANATVPDMLRRLDPTEGGFFYAATTLARAAALHGIQSVDPALFVSAVADLYEAFTRSDLKGAEQPAEVAAITERYMARARAHPARPADPAPPSAPPPKSDPDEI